MNEQNERQNYKLESKPFKEGGQAEIFHILWNFVVADNRIESTLFRILFSLFSLAMRGKMGSGSRLPFLLVQA